MAALVRWAAAWGRAPGNPVTQTRTGDDQNPQPCPCIIYGFLQKGLENEQKQCKGGSLCNTGAHGNAVRII